MRLALPLLVMLVAALVNATSALVILTFTLSPPAPALLPPRERLALEF